MRQIILIILTFTTFQVIAQKLKPDINNLVLQIEKYNVLESEHVGIAGETTDQYRNFIKLRDNATNDELLMLLNHENSVVKGYSSWALVDNKYSKLSEILVEFLRTGETVTSQSGCIVSEDNLSRMFYSRIFYQGFHNKLNKEDSLFYSQQVRQLDSVILYSERIQQIDSAILFSSNSLYLLKRALENNNANPETYERIKELALIDKNHSAIVALAKYQRKDDIPKLIELGNKSFLGIASFPDKAFWSFLKAYQTTEKSKHYFLAVSSFQNLEATNLLSEVYLTLNSAQIAYLGEALTKNYCSHYQDLLLEIWKNNKIIDIIATKKLIKDCPEKAAKYFANGLLTNKKFNFQELDYNYGSKDTILSLMLDNIKLYQKDMLLKVCDNNIQTAKFTDLYPILSFIEENKMSETTNALIARVQEKNTAYEIFHLTKTLLSFNNDETKNIVATSLIEKKEDWDWGNWSEHFRELLKSHDIKVD